VVDLQAGEQLPQAAASLTSRGDGRARRCPQCGSWFRYDYDYEYGALGDGWENASLERIDPEAAKALLLECPPSDRLGEELRGLGIADGLERILASLHAAVDGSDKHSVSVAPSSLRHSEALTRLVMFHASRGACEAIAELLRHRRAEVRANTLYHLMTRENAMWFQAARADTDPNPETRLRAVEAARGALADEGRLRALSTAVVACLSDGDDSVRSNAAWAFAAAMEREGGPLAPFDALNEAVPLLAERVADPSPKVRQVAARALFAAARLGMFARAAPGLSRALGGSERAVRLAAAELLGRVRSLGVDIAACRQALESCAAEGDEELRESARRALVSRDGSR
jgi:HEAT repeat protein